MDNERDQLTQIFELCAGLSDPDEAEAELSLEATPEQEKLVQDAHKLNAVLARLRDNTEVEPAEDLLPRFWERVRHYQQTQLPEAAQAWENLEDVSPAAGSHEQEVTTTELFELYSGNLPDSEAGSVERRLASCPAQQGAVSTIAKLVAIFNWLRREGEIPSAPDAAARFQYQVQSDLDAEIDAATRPMLPPIPLAAQPQPVHQAVPASGYAQESHQGTSRVRWHQTIAGTTAALFISAVCLVLAVTFFTVPFTQPDHVSQVAESVRSIEDFENFRQLKPELASLVADGLISLEEVSPAEIANRHMLLDLALRGSQPEQLNTAKFLVEQGLREPSAQPQVATLPLSLESVAYAGAAEEGLSAQFKSQLRRDIWERNYEKVLERTSGRDEPACLLLTVWAKDQLAEHDGLPELVEELEARRDLPLAAQVFLAGVHRSLGEPQKAVQRLEQFASQVQELAFHVGYIYDHDLLNESKAAEFYLRLLNSSNEKLAAYGRHGLAESRTITILKEPFEFDKLEWESVEEDGRYFHHVQTIPQGQERILHLGGGDLFETAALVRGERAWKNYQITLDFQFGDERDLGIDPRVGILGYFREHEANYRVSLGLSGMQLVGRYPVSDGIYHASHWPSDDLPYSSSVLPGGQIEPGKWYTAKLRLENHLDHVRIAAKVWQRGTPEPDHWSLIESDYDPRRHQSGKVGLLVTDGAAYLDNVHVELLSQ